MLIVVIKAAVIWLGIACLAVANGMVREYLFVPALGMKFALPLSGLTLSAVVFLLAYLSVNFIGVRRKSGCFAIGVQWVVMTLAFEFFFGYFVAGQSWVTLLQVFDVASGDLFVLVLLTSLLSPYAVARIRRVV